MQARPSYLYEGKLVLDKKNLIFDIINLKIKLILNLMFTKNATL